MNITVRFTSNTYRATCDGTKGSASNTVGPLQAAEALARKLDLDPGHLRQEASEQFTTVFSHPNLTGHGVTIGHQELASSASTTDNCELFRHQIQVLLTAMDKAAQFIEGFEGDETQEGIAQLLETICTARDFARGKLRAQYTAGLTSPYQSPNQGTQHMNAIAQIIPTAPGAPFEGGFYAGRFLLDGAEYALIVSPKAEGELEEAVWGERRKDIPGATSCNDGQANTRAMAEAGSDLARWMLALDINGFTDWYLPSRDELELCYRHLKPTIQANYTSFRDGENPSSLPAGYPYTSINPAQTSAAEFMADGQEDFVGVWYWASTQYSPYYAWVQGFGGGDQLDVVKGLALRARAVRRFKVTP